MNEQLPSEQKALLVALRSGKGAMLEVTRNAATTIEAQSDLLANVRFWANQIPEAGAIRALLSENGI